MGRDHKPLSHPCGTAIGFVDELLAYSTAVNSMLTVYREGDSVRDREPHIDIPRDAAMGRIDETILRPKDHIAEPGSRSRKVLDLRGLSFTVPAVNQHVAAS